MAITNTRKKLISLLPANTNEQQLYEVPASSQIDAVLRICNQDTVLRNYSIAHTDVGHGDTAASADDFIAYLHPIDANDTHEYSIHASATETIRIKADIASKISFHLSGNLKVLS